MSIDQKVDSPFPTQSSLSYAIVNAFPPMNTNNLGKFIENVNALHWRHLLRQPSAFVQTPPSLEKREHASSPLKKSWVLLLDISERMCKFCLQVEHLQGWHKFQHQQHQWIWLIIASILLIAQPFTSLSLGRTLLAKSQISRTELAFLIYNIPCFRVKLQAHMHVNLYKFISFIRRFHSHHLTKWHKHRPKYKRTFMIELRVQDRFMLHSSAKIYTLDNIITELWYYEFDSVAIHFSAT